MARFEDFSTFDMYMALVIPVVCVIVTSSVLVINYIRHRDTNVPAPNDTEKVSIAEVPGDTVEMYVELEAEEEVNGSTRRNKVHEVEERGTGGTQKV
jgi:hypothetical protein